MSGHGKWGALSGLIFCALWAPVALVLPLLPDLGSAPEIERVYRDHEALLKTVVLLLSLGFIFFLGFLGVLVERLRHAEQSGPLTWVVFGTALMFMTGLNVALGLAASTTLLSDSVPDSTTHAFHAGAYVLAAPAAAPGMAFFAAIAVLSFRTGVFPRPLAWLAIAGVVANLGALGGFFALTGPLNSGNGVIGGLPAPLLAWWLWTLSASWWLMARTGAQTNALPARGGA